MSSFGKRPDRPQPAELHDGRFATQPERAASVCNPSGYMNNSWARLELIATAPRT